ncbi:MAG: methylated-DNA--[protein]-cysteine S-methyltransferase [Acidobacteriia bacterium]|nr:methylated-DNA--[protein]-cysteine S-methyltransferase [Terriglobia bacterium]
MLAWTEAEVAESLVLQVAAAAGAVCAIAFDRSRPPAGERTDDAPLLREAIRQLRSYFRGELREFTLPLEMAGTEFQKRVWRELLKIPYGETRSYGDLASALGSPNAVRAVDPIAIVVPCHRVIGSGGKLVGYGGGLPLKRRLLALEQAHAGLFA